MKLVCPISAQPKLAASPKIPKGFIQINLSAGDFLYFAPAGHAFTIPSAGTVSAVAKPGPTDPIWIKFVLGIAMADFYKSNLIQITDTSFHPLGGAGSIMGWLKRQRFDATNGLYIVDDWWVNLNVTDSHPNRA